MGIRRVTTSLARDFVIAKVAAERDFRFGEGIGFDFRAEATNVFNMVSLNNPTATLSSSIDSHITGAAPNRILQLGARLTF